MIREIALASFHEIDSCVHSDSHNPARKRRVLSKARQLVVSTKKRLLCRLFRIGLIACNTKSDTRNRAEMAVHQHAIGIPVASEYVSNRLCLRLVHSPIRQWISPLVRSRQNDFLCSADSRFGMRYTTEQRGT